MQASMSEVVLPLDGRDDELRHSTEMDQIGSSRRDESQLASQIDDDTLEDVDIVIDHALVQYFGTTLPSVTQNEHQPSPPPRVTRGEVPVEQELSKTSEPKNFSIDSVDPNLVTIDRYGSAIDSNWDETEADFNYYLPNYAQEVVITTETNSPHAPDKEPTERLVAAPNDYSLDVIVPEKLGVQGFPFEEALNPLTSTPNSNPLQEESAFFDDMDLNPAGLKDCRSFYEAQTTELSAEGSPENVSPGCSSMHIVPMSEGVLEVGTQSPPEELAGSVGLGAVGKNVIVEMNPSASPDVARVPCSNLVCQPMSPPPSYRQTMAAAYQKTVYDPLSCCGPYGNVVKNKIVLSYSGEGVLSETDSRDSDYGPPKLDAIDDNHTSTNDQPNDYPPMLEPADPAFPSAGKVPVHVIPSAAGEALESIKKLSLGVVPENGLEHLEGSSQYELNECLGKLVPSITPEFSKQIPSGYIVNDMYNVRNITPESSTIASCVDNVGGLPDLLPVSEEPKLYRTFNRTSPKKKKPETENLATSCSSQNKSVDKTSSLIEPATKFNAVLNLPECASKPNLQGLRSAHSSNENMSIPKKEPSTSSAGVGKPIGPIAGMVRVAKAIPQQTPIALMHDTGRANFKIIPTTATTINLGVKKLTIVKPQNMKDKVVLLKRATVEKLLSSDFESMNLKKLTSVQSSNLNKMVLPQGSLDNRCAVKSIESKNLPTPSVLSNPAVLKEPRDDSSPSTVKGTSKVAVGKNAVALKVSLPLDLLSVKPSLVPDPPKTVSCEKGDEPIEKAVTADGEVDPNVIMDAMKVSAPFLFPVTKPEVTKKVIKPDAGKVEQPPTLQKEKKKSAAPPVVVKMTSKANRKIFSPIREVEFTIEKAKLVKRPEISLAETNDTQNAKSVLLHPQPMSDMFVHASDRLSTSHAHSTITTKEEAAVKTDRSKQAVVQPVSNDPKKKALEPSLMKQVDNASDDLSSFLSSLSGPKERPKGVENLEKVVYETITGASACDVAIKTVSTTKTTPSASDSIKSVTSTKTTPANDPIIIPPSAIRNDDPLSLKVGLKPCKFRDVRKDEMSKKPLNSQVARSVPSSSRSSLAPANKPTAPLRRDPPLTKSSIESRPISISSAENAVVFVEKSKEATLVHEEHTQIEPEEKVHPIVELINQLIESNSKSPQIFSEPDKTRSEEVPKQVAEAKLVPGKAESQKDGVMNDENRAKEDGILAGVVKERTSKLIQKARDMVYDGHVALKEGDTHSTEESLGAKESARQSQVAVLEKPSNQDRTMKEHCVSIAKTTVEEVDTKGLGGPLNRGDSLPKAYISDGDVEQRGLVAPGMGTSNKTIPPLPSKKTEVPVSSNGSVNGAEAYKVGAISSSSQCVSVEKKLSIVEASASKEMPSNQQNMGFESRVPKELETMENQDLTFQLKTTDSPQSAHPLAEKSPKEQIPTIPDPCTSNKLQISDKPVTISKASEESKGRSKKDADKDKVSTKGAPFTLTEESIVSKSLDEPITATNPVSAGKLEGLKQNTRRGVKRSNRIQAPSDVPVVEAVEELRVNKVNPQTATDIQIPAGKLEGFKQNTQREVICSGRLPAPSAVPAVEVSKELRANKVKENETPKNTPTSTGEAIYPSEVLMQESVSHQSRKIVVDSAIKVSGELNGKKVDDSKGSVDAGDSSQKAPPSRVQHNPKREKGNKDEGKEATSKTTGSSKRAIPSTEKLPTQLIVSIPTVAFSNQPNALDLLVPSNGSSEELKSETGHFTKHGPQTVESKKKLSCRDEPSKQTRCSSVPQNHHASEAIEIVSVVKPLEEPTPEKTTVTKDATVSLSEKAPPVKDSFLNRQNVPAVDKRSSARRKSRGEVPINTSDELKGKEVNDAEVPLGKSNSLPENKHESEAIEMVPAVKPSEEPTHEEKTTATNVSTVNLPEKVPVISESLLTLQNVPAVDKRSSMRRKSRGEGPISTSDELKGKGMKDAKEPLGKIKSLPQNKHESEAIEIVPAVKPLEQPNQEKTTVTKDAAVNISEKVAPTVKDSFLNRHVPAVDKKSSTRRKSRGEVSISTSDELNAKTLPENKHESEAIETLPVVKPLEEPNQEKTTITKDAAVNLSEKVPPIKDSFLNGQQIPAVDKRSSTRRKSRGEVPVSTSSESIGENVKDTKEPLGKSNSLEGCPDEATRKSDVSNSVERVNPLLSKQHSSGPLSVLKDVRDDQTKNIRRPVGTVEDKADLSIEKTARLQKIPEKPSHRMRTRGSIPALGGEDGVNAFNLKEGDDITEPVIAVESVCSNADVLQLKSKISTDEKPSGRPRTRSETNHEKKIFDEGCTENLEPVESVNEAVHGHQNAKAPLKKSCGDTATCSVSQTVIAPTSSDKVREQKQESIDETPTVNVRTRGKIERKPVTVKPISATPKKGNPKFLGNQKSPIGDSDELDTVPSLSDEDFKTKESTENITEMSKVNDDAAFPKNTISTRRSSSQKNSFLGSIEANASIISESRKPLSFSQKSVSKRIGQVPKQLAPKRNRRVSMKPRKVSKLETNVKTRVNDVYDFTDDEGQSIEIETIDTFRKVSGKSTKMINSSINRFETSQESLLSDDENRSNNQTRIGRNKNSKAIPGKAKRRASPRKSMSEPRKLESKKGKEMALKNALSESSESLLSNAGETVLPPELQENLRNSRSESIRLAKQSRLKKSPGRNPSASADVEEARAPQPSSTRGTRRASGSRAPSVENSSSTGKKDGKDLDILPDNESTMAKEEAKPKTRTRETRRSLGTPSSGDKHVNEASKESGKKEGAKMCTAVKARKRSPQKKDANVAEKLSRDTISEKPTLCVETANTISESRSAADSGSLYQVSTRSKSRDSINEEDTSPRTMGDKEIIQPGPVGGGEPKSPKPVVDAKSVMKSSEHEPKVGHKINENVPEVSNSSKSDHEIESMKSLSTKADEKLVDQASSVRTRSKTIENELNTVPKSSTISDEGLFLPKLRSSAGKKVEIFRETTHEEIDVQCPVSTKEKLSEILPNNVGSDNRSNALDKLKKTKKSDSLLFSGGKDDPLPIAHISGVVNKSVTVATVETTGKEKHQRAKKGGLADNANEIMLAQSPIVTQDIVSRNAEAVSLKTPPMDSTAAQELDNAQPVGAMSQHGEPEGAKSTTRTAQLHSLVVPLDEGGAGNSLGLLRKKNKKIVVVEKKKLAQSSPMSNDKKINGEVITGKASDALIKSGTKRQTVDCLVPPIKFEARRNQVDSEVVSKPSLSLSGSSSSGSERGESSKVSKHTTDVFPNLEIKSTRRITRSCLSTESPTRKPLRSASKVEQECAPPNQNNLDNATSDLSDTEAIPCRSNRKRTFSREELSPTLSEKSPADPVEESLLKPGLENSAEVEEPVQIPIDTPLLNKLSRTEDVLQAPASDACKTPKATRGKKSEVGLKHPSLADDEMKFAQPKDLRSENLEGALAHIIAPGPRSGKHLSIFEKNMTLKTKPSTKKNVSAKPTSYLLPKVCRVKTTTKDVCEISGEAEKLFEEASLDGKEGFDVIVPSPGKSPDSTTQHSSEIIIPALSSELDTLPTVEISEDAHGVTSTTELGNVLSDTERKMLILSEDFEPSESSTKKEDESVSSTTADSTKTTDTNVESSLDHPVVERVSPSNSLVGESCNQGGGLKVMAKRATFPGETVIQIPEHPKKIWRVNPVHEVPSTPTESTPKVLGSLESELSCIIKPHITNEDLKKTPLKKRQVWAYAACCSSNDNVKSQHAIKSSVAVEGDPPAVHSTNDASLSSGRPKSLPVGSSSISPEREDSKKTNDVVCSGLRSVDRLPHSICNILAVSTDKVVSNDSAEPLSQGVGSSGSESVGTNREKLVADNTRSKSRETFLIKRKMNKKRRGSLRSIKNRLLHKRHLQARNRRGKLIKKRCKVGQKTETNHKKLSPSPESLLTDKTVVTDDVKQNSCVDQVNRDCVSNGNDKNSEEAHSFGGNTIVDSNNISALNNDANTVQHSPTSQNCQVVPNSSKSLDHVKRPLKVSSPYNDKCAELIVDTTDKEIDDEESPPFSPIGVDTTKPTDWDANANSTSVDCSKPVDKNPPARLPNSFTSLNAPPEDVTYRRPHKTERVRSYSNDEPDRSHIHGPKTRSRRKSHPENIPVDLSHPGTPVFGMKIPPNLPKLDLTGITPIYHEAREQAPIPYDVIPTTLVRLIPTPPPSFASPHRRIPIHGPIRPIPTLRVPSPGAPFAPQFTPPDEMRIELSSRMNAYSVSAFHSTQKKSPSPNFTGHKKVDYNPLLFAQENNYLLNAGLSNVMQSLPSASTFTNSPSLKPNKSRSVRGKIDSTALNMTPSTSKSGIVNLRTTPPDIDESPTRDIRLHEAQVQLLITNPELSISRISSGGNGHSLISGSGGGGPHSDTKKPKPLNSFASSSCIDSVQSKKSVQEIQRVEVEEMIEPLDVVTCELEEEKTDSLVHLSRMNPSDITVPVNTALQQQTPKNMEASKCVRNEPKQTLVCMEQVVLNRNEGAMEPVRMGRAIIPDGNVSQKTPHEKLPGKIGSTCRRRISILDSRKPHKKNSSVVVSTNSFIDVSSVSHTDRTPSPSSTIVLEPKEHELGSKTTKVLEKSNEVLSLDSTCSDVLKNSSGHCAESKRGLSPSRKIHPLEALDVTTSKLSVTEPILEYEPKNEEAGTKHGGTKAKEPGCSKPKEEPHSSVGSPVMSSITEKSNESSCKEVEAPKSVVPEPILLARPKVIDEDGTRKKMVCETELTGKPKTVAALEPGQIRSVGVKQDSGKAVNSTKEQGKVDPTVLGHGRKVISKEIIPRKDKECLSDKVAEPIAKPLTDSKPNVAKNVEKSSVPTTNKSKTDPSASTNAQLKPDEILTPSSKPIIHNKLKAAVGPSPVFAKKSAPQPKTDVIKFAIVPNELESGSISKPVSGPIIVGQLDKTPNRQKSGVIEKSVPKLKTGTLNLATAPVELETGEISTSVTVADVKQNEPTVAQKARENAKCVPSPKTDTSNLTCGLSQLETDKISVSASNTVTDIKQNKPVAGEKPRSRVILPSTPKIDLTGADAVPRTDEISKTVCEKTSNTKQNETTVGQKVGEDRKSISSPKTDASNLPSGLIKLEHNNVSTSASETVTDVKQNEPITGENARDGEKSPSTPNIFLASAHTELKTDEISKAVPEKTSDAKQNETTVGQKAGEDEKSISSPKTDASNLTSGLSKLRNNNISTSASETVTGIKQNEPITGENARGGEKSPSTPNIFLASVHTELKTDEISKAVPKKTSDAKRNETTVGQKAGEDEKSISSPTTVTSKLTNAHARLKTDKVSKPESQATAVVKPRPKAIDRSVPKVKPEETIKGAIIRPSAKVEKSVPELKTDDCKNESAAKPRVDVVGKEDVIDPESSTGNSYVEPTLAIVHQHTSDHLYCAKVDTIPPPVISKPKLDNENSGTGFIAGVDSKTNYINSTTLDTDDSLTKASTDRTDDKLETVSGQGNELKTNRVSCTDGPITEISSKSAEEQGNAEDVPLQTDGPDTDTSTKTENDREGPLKEHSHLESPTKSEDRSEGMMPPNQCPPKELLCVSTPLDGKEVTDGVASKDVKSTTEIENHIDPVPVDCESLVPPVPAPVDCESLAPPVGKTVQDTEAEGQGVDTESKSTEVSEVIASDNQANLNKARSPEDKNVLPNDLPSVAPPEQSGETEEPICSVAVELTVDKTVEDEVVDNSAVIESVEEQREVKPIAIDSAAAVGVEQECKGKKVGALVAVQGKDNGERSAEAKSLEQKTEVEEPVIDSKANCAKKEGVAIPLSVADVTISSETAESNGTGAGGQMEMQCSEVGDSPSSELLSIENPSDLPVQENPCKEVEVQESSEVREKCTCETDEVTSIVSKSNVENETPSVPERSAVEPTQEKTQSLAIVTPSSPLKCTVVETPPQSPAKVPSTEPEDACSSFAQEKEGDLPDKCSEISAEQIGPSTVPVVSDLGENPSPASAEEKFDDGNSSSTSSNSLKPIVEVSSLEPSPSDQRANDGPNSTTLTDTKETDHTKIHECSSQISRVDTAESVPNTTETGSINQPTESLPPLPSEPTKDAFLRESVPGNDIRIRGVLKISSNRPERKRKRPAWLEDGPVASKLHKSDATGTPFEVDSPGEPDGKIRIDPSVPKVEVELLCQTVVRKLQENLGVSIDQSDLAKLQKCWAEFRTSLSRGAQVEVEKLNQSIAATRKSSPERVTAFDHAKPSTSRGSDHGATIHPGSRWVEKEDNDEPRGLVAILHERKKLAKTSLLQPPPKRGEKRTVSQAFAQNVNIYKDPRVTGRSTYERTGGGGGRQQLLPYEIPVLPSTSPIRHLVLPTTHPIRQPVLPTTHPIRQPPQMSYSWILEHLRERRKKNQHYESNIPAQPCKEFMRPQEEYTRPSLREVYNSFAGEYGQHMLGYWGRVSSVHEVPLPASTPSSSTSRVPTFTISSDSEDSNPGNPEDTVNERDEVRRRIRRKSNTPAVSSCSCPDSGHGAYRTTCPACRKERFQASGALSPIRSSRPPLYAEISHVERQESARVFGKRAATVGGGDDTITDDSEDSVRRIKNLLVAWPSNPDSSNDDPPIRESFTSYQKDVSLPHVIVSSFPPPQSSSSAHPPPDMERVAGATFQRCLQQKPFSERGRPEDSNDNVQHDTTISTEYLMTSHSHPATSAEDQSCVPYCDGPPAKKKKS